MKRLIPFLLLVFTVSCSQNKHLTSSVSNSKSQQQLKKSYGPGGKIIYGSKKELGQEMASVEELETDVDVEVPEEYHNKKQTNPKKTSLKKKTKTLFADFKDVVLVRKNFPKIGTSKASIKEYNDPAMLRADQHAKSGFILAIVATVALLLIFLLAAAASSFDALVILFILGGLFAIVMYVLSFVFSILGLKSEKNKVFAVIGLAISAFAMFLLFISIVSSTL